MNRYAKTNRMLNYLYLLLAVVCSPLWAASSQSPALPPQTSGQFSFTVLADTAYNTPDDYPAYYRLIKQINQNKPAFTLHLGDVLGLDSCSNTLLQQVKKDFKRFDHPVIYTPGDNEWTDCLRQDPNNSYQPEERLAYLRKHFFAKDSSTLGTTPIALQRQHARSPSGLPENAFWWQQQVLFATVHLVGSNNGLPSTNNADHEEFNSRNAANLQWLTTAFKTAQQEQAKALVVAFHGNIFAPPKSPDGYAQVRELIGELSDTFSRPILLVHADFHEFIIDRPYATDLLDDRGKHVIRLQTFGWPEAKAVKVQVDTTTADMFSFTPLSLSGNHYVIDRKKLEALKH